MNKYDSMSDTLLHIKRVSQLLTEASAELIRRANIHDNSKLESPEKDYLMNLLLNLLGVHTVVMNINLI